MAIRFPAMRQHCTGREAGLRPGRYCAPGGARKPYGLQGNGLPHQRARWFAMTDLGVRFVWMGVRSFPKAGGGGKTPALRCRPASAPIPTHPAPNGAPVGRGLAPAGHLQS